MSETDGVGSKTDIAMSEIDGTRSKPDIAKSEIDIVESNPALVLSETAVAAARSVTFAKSANRGSAELLREDRR